MVPSDRYLLETDSPYLAPVAFRGRQYEFVAEQQRVKTSR